MNSSNQQTPNILEDLVLQIQSAEKIRAQQNINTSFPLDSLPPILKNVVISLHHDTQIPIELICQVALAAASLACQSIVNVKPHYSQTPEPCSLYFLTLADPGEGKTTINKFIMKPFYDFSERMKKKYDNDLRDYKQEHDVWKIKKKALANSYTQAIKKRYSGEKEEEEIKEHLSIEPHKPKRFQLIYDDVTKKAFIEGLQQHPDAGIISDEANTFFTGYLKHHIGLLNKAWDGETNLINRTNNESYEIKACLTFSLMSQPGVFNEYLKKQGTMAIGSGFLSRFLFASVISNQGERCYSPEGCLSPKTISSLNTFYEKIELFLNFKNDIDYEKNSHKKTLEASQEAIEAWAQIKSNFEKPSSRGGPWSHIREVVSKSGANIYRLATILKQFEVESNSLNLNRHDIQSASDIIFWNLEQAKNLFYPFSEQYKINLDVRELYSWMKSYFNKNNHCAFPKNDILQFGPRKFRKIDVLDSVLNIIISQTNFCVIQSQVGGVLYISLKSIDGFILSLPTSTYPTNYFIVPIINTNNDVPIINLSDL
ncbi:YfjI family protein [Morganella psychrotolerans]|uniref:DUF3987 domain-containing protein n=1 Tax=Morganella psychrotolerans TaxID=368603 RepID=A0A1B8H2C6_9GAMM|nr:YfjI family protein [Morganella psychrotolerans]OBU03216.1 hypothetical protein AYY18_11220 [Morganella psychrotolerans]